MFKISRIILFIVIINQINNMNAEFNADYHNNSSRQYELGKKAIESFDLKGNERVLDVGCGTGRTTVDCAKRLHSGTLVAIDISQSMIEFAQKEYEAISNLTFKQQDVTQLNFNEEFDFAYSIFCLHWVSDQQTAIQKIAQSLKPGGKCFLYMSVTGSLITAWDNACKYVAQHNPHWAPYIANTHNIKPEKNWIQWTEQVGFTIVNKHVKIDQLTFPTLNDYKNHVKALGVASDLPQAERDELLDHVIKHCFAQLGYTEGPYKTNQPLLILELQKPI